MPLKMPLPIGIESYKKLIDNQYYYVDKTLMIKELLDRGGAANLFTRPRRFGKTLTLSMIRTFFEVETDIYGNVTDNRRYFEDRKIMEAGEEYTRHMGKYPVIFLSLKSAKQPDFETAYESIKGEIKKEFLRHRYILQGAQFTDGEIEQYNMLMNGKADRALYAGSLVFLSDCLKAYHGKNTIILLDEYDVPLENAHFEGFYDRMVSFIRSLFESALKTNDSLEFAVITGCLRISRESIFTGLNNLKVLSIMSNTYSEYFGFTEQEVLKMLEYYDILGKEAEVKKWYDGYVFGETEVYNPWSIINYVECAVEKFNAIPKPYWSNTSSNSIIRELIESADSEVKNEIEELIAGGTIEKPVHEDITYEDIHKTKDNLWNFLFFTGYLKAAGQRFETDTLYLTMKIPNAEVRYIYRNTILEWFNQKLTVTDLTPLYNAIIEGNCEEFGNLVTDQLVETISFYDYAENYYHGFLAGLLKGCKGYITISNRESGNGRPDIIMRTASIRGIAIIIEIKVVKDFDDMEKGCKAALQQIEDMNYQESLYKEGYRKFKKYGVCFYRKECMAISCED